jgi:transporter family protein
MFWLNVFGISALTTVSSLSLKQMQKHHMRHFFDFFSFLGLMNLGQILVLTLLPPYTKLVFSAPALLFGLSNSVTSVTYYVFMTFAFASGPLLLTNSILALYLVIPITFGLIFWQETLSFLTVGGLLLFMVSVLLITNSTYYEKEDEKKIQLRWLFLVLAAFLANGITSTVSKQAARISPDTNREYLLSGRVFVIIIALLVRLAWRLWQRRKKQPLELVWKDKRFLLLNLISGLSMGVANILFMTSVADSASALFFPATQAFGIIFMFVFSRLIFKERLSQKALAGFIMIVVAIMLIGFG